MHDLITAILLHDEEEPVGALKPVLEEQGLKTCRACTCGQAARLVAQATAPCLLFTDVKLPDGSWADVLQVAARARVPANVIVVSRHVDIRFYVDVIERGAFDFITPPFAGSDLAHVVRCAGDNLLAQKFAQARSA